MMALGQLGLSQHGLVYFQSFQLHNMIYGFVLFVCFVALRPKSTEQAVKQYFVHILLLVTDNNPS